MASETHPCAEGGTFVLHFACLPWCEGTLAGTAYLKSFLLQEEEFVEAISRS